MAKYPDVIVKLNEQEKTNHYRLISKVRLAMYNAGLKEAADEYVKDLEKNNFSSLVEITHQWITVEE